MRLYSGPLSLFTAKVRIALAEKGLDYELVSVGWSLAERYLPHHPEVAARNPKAEVPVLVDGDLSLYDSTIILEYLEDRYPEPALYPRDIAARARCRQLEAAADEVIFPRVWDLIEESLYPPAASGRDADRADQARSELGLRYAELDGVLRDGAAGGAEFLCGEFSVADIGTFIMLNAAATLGGPPDPALSAYGRWHERVRSRDSVAAELESMTSFLGEALAKQNAS